jgi:DDE superfamily endonuclease
MSQRSRSSKRDVTKPPASGRQPSGKLSKRDVALSLEALIEFHRGLQGLFQRREQRDWSFFYLCGQLANLERKTIETMVLNLLSTKPRLIRAVQQFMGQGAWNVEPLIQRLQSLVAEWLGEPDGVLIVDGSGFPKQGQASVGVAPQYCGHLGKVANCQEGIFLVYASRKGHAFLDERLYMPESWLSAGQHQRRQQCGVPESVIFQTEPALGLEMIQAVLHPSCAVSLGHVRRDLWQKRCVSRWNRGFGQTLPGRSPGRYSCVGPHAGRGATRSGAVGTPPFASTGQPDRARFARAKGGLLMRGISLVIIG